MKLAYQLELVAESGEVLWSGRAKPDGNRIQIKPGWYTATVCGSPESNCTSARISVSEGMLAVVRLKLGVHWVN